MKPIHLKLRARLQSAAQSQQGIGQNSKFDESTGQVYTERTAPIQCTDNRNWTQRRHYQSYAKLEIALEQEFNGDGATSIVNYQRGSRTLRDLAVQCTVQNISYITLEIIESLPPQLIHQVWDVVKESERMSFDTWTMFSKALRSSMPDPNLFQFLGFIRRPMSPLHIYTAPLAANPFEILTSLSITTYFPLPDLVRLSDLPNLAVLEIIDTETSEMEFDVSDRLVREWHLAALNDRAFSVLRFLRLWNFENVTFQSLSFLYAFPALVVYDIDGCGTVQPSIPNDFMSKWSFAGNHYLGVLTDSCFTRNSQAQFRPLLLTRGKGTESQQTDDQGKMRFIPRKEIPTFLGQTAEPPSLEPRNRNRSVMFRRFDKWANFTNELLSMVGYLRNDADLGRAGYDISGQAVVGNVLVNSIPIVSLRIGLDVETYIIPGSVHTGFIRENLTHQTDTNAAEDSHNTVEKEVKESTGGHDAKRKQEGKDVVPAKKRLLDDLLDSFL